jgi:hypothetical protein
MTEKKVETVTLIAPNGVQVSVAESKVAERVAAGYQVPEKRAPKAPRPVAKQ